jgi:hypothetical protein
MVDEEKEMYSAMSEEADDAAKPSSYSHRYYTKIV